MIESLVLGLTKKYGIVISGRSLEHVYSDDELTQRFFLYSVNCAAAVVCRATKMQKVRGRPLPMRALYSGADAQLSHVHVALREKDRMYI